MEAITRLKAYKTFTPAAARQWKILERYELLLEIFLSICDRAGKR